MKKKGEYRPSAFVVDDDAALNRILEVVLGKLGIKTETFSDPEKFLTRLKQHRPSICLIDLNLGGSNAGFELIGKIRTLGFADLPIMVASTNTDRQAIAHALELGANDYIVKPIRRDLLASKLAGFVKSRELDEATGSFGAKVAGEMVGSIDLPYEAKELDELGIKVAGKHLIGKGTVVALGGELMSQITGDDRPRLLTTASTWVEPDGARYGAYLEFDLTDTALLQQIRKWLLSREGK